MKNELLTIGPVTIHGYGLMIGIGVIAAYLTAEYRARKLKLDADQVFSLVIWCLVFGGLGSKLLFCLTQLDTILRILPICFIPWQTAGWYTAD